MLRRFAPFVGLAVVLAVALPLLYSLSVSSPPPPSTAIPTITPTPVPEADRYVADLQESVFLYEATGPGVLSSIKIRGSFKLTEGSIVFQPEGDGYRLHVKLVISGNSATAPDSFMLNLMRTVLDVDHYPTATFEGQSSEIIKLGNGPIPFTAVGTLELRTIKRPLMIPFTMTLADGVVQGEGDVSVDLLNFSVNVPTMFIKNVIDFRVKITARKDAAPQG